MGRIRVLLMVVLLAWLVAESANATLITIGTANYEGSSYNLIYDKESSLIWLDYSEPVNTWEIQEQWATGLSEVGILSYALNAGYNNIDWSGVWRLPEILDGLYIHGYDGTTTSGYNITSSEFGHLFYTELCNNAYYDTNGNIQPGWGFLNKGPFTNLYSYSYWSGTEYSDDMSLAWSFEGYVGAQNPSTKAYSGVLGMAVRSGQVLETTPVPEPSTMLLLGSGLAGLAFWRKRKSVK